MRLKTADEWSFSDLTPSDTSYASHGYHRYPAKFIPQLVRRIISKYSSPGDIVLDPFGGCGTTNVECLLHNRNSYAVDVNDVAVLIAKAKTKAFPPKILQKENDEILKSISRKLYIHKNFYFHAHPRLQEWFSKSQYNKLMSIYLVIAKVRNKNLQNFYKCCFSNILKNCSIWYSKSIKPMRDLDKKPADPFEAFKKHLYYMTKKNDQLYDLLKRKEKKDVSSIVRKGDAKKLTFQSKSVDLIVTSPPYATSYEYADIHQLTSLWFKYSDNIAELKKNFIGTSVGLKEEVNPKSDRATLLLNKIRKFDNNLAKQISNYYANMYESYAEMKRVLRKNGYLALVLGDTSYKGIKIPNREVTVEQLKELGFQIYDLIKRKMNSKIFTPFRNKVGRFSSRATKTQKIYQHEYIIVARS